MCAWESTPTVVSNSDNNSEVSKKFIPSLAIGIPYRGLFSINMFKSLYTVELPPINDMIFDGGSRPLHLSRNVIVSNALQNKFEYLFWNDSDVVLPNKDVIVNLMKKKQKVIGALYVTRADPRIVVGTGIGGKMITVDDEDVKNGKVIEMEAIGMGATLTHCSVYHELGKKRKWRCLINHKKDGYDGALEVDYNEALDNNFKCPKCDNILVANFFRYTHGEFTGYEIDEDGEKMYIGSEDYYFCHKLSSIGITPKLDTSISTWHEASGWLMDKSGIFTMQRGGGVA